MRSRIETRRKRRGVEVEENRSGKGVPRPCDPARHWRWMEQFTATPFAMLVTRSPHRAKTPSIRTKVVCIFAQRMEGSDMDRRLRRPTGSQRGHTAVKCKGSLPSFGVTMPADAPNYPGGKYPAPTEQVVAPGRMQLVDEALHKSG